MDKLTPQEKERLRAENQQKYGLTKAQVEAIKLPAVQHLVEIFQVEKIINPKSTLSTMEKINHLIKLEDALLNKLDLVRKSGVEQKRA